MPVPVILATIGKALISPTAHTIIGASTLAGVTYGNIKLHNIDGKISEMKASTDRIEASVATIAASADSAIGDFEDALGAFSDDICKGLADSLISIKNNAAAPTPTPTAPTSEALEAKFDRLTDVVGNLATGFNNFVATFATPTPPTAPTPTPPTAPAPTPPTAPAPTPPTGG